MNVCDLRFLQHCMFLCKCINSEIVTCFSSYKIWGYVQLISTGNEFVLEAVVSVFSGSQALWWLRKRQKLTVCVAWSTVLAYVTCKTNQSIMATPHVLVCHLDYKFMSYESWSGSMFIMHIYWVLYFQL
jgi:hypothetical protein